MEKMFALFVPVLLLGIFVYTQRPLDSSQNVLSPRTESLHWFLLQRKSNIEYLYEGVPGYKEKSKLLKTFKVKTGVPGKSPTPLPNLLGRNYWVITDKVESKDNPETAPYFLSLDVPVSGEEPFGPEPYRECSDPLTGETMQCNWEIPGYFGLHGVNGDSDRLSLENIGS